MSSVPEGAARRSGYRIVSLTVENVKRLTAVTIDAPGDVVVLGGRNAQGKSSVLDSIEYTIAGERAVCEEPIHRGADTARVILDLGDIIVTKVWRRGQKPVLTVTTRDGASYPSPQRLLAGLYSKVGIDPSEIMGMKPPERLAALKQCVRTVDWPTLEAKRRGLYEQRTDVGRELKQMRGQFAGMPGPHLDAPDGAISVADVAKQLEAANARNTEIEMRRREEQQLAAAVESAKAEVLRLWDAYQAASEAQYAAESALGRSMASTSTARPVDVAPLRDQIANAERLNRLHRENEERATVARRLDALDAKVTELSAGIDRLDAQMAQAIADADLGVPGLGLSGEDVTLNGLPFDQASSTQRLIAAASIGIAQNPRLRVILMREAAMFDDEHLAAIAQFAVANDCQVWLERVGSGAEVSVVIEDGMVAEDRTHAAAAAVEDGPDATAPAFLRTEEVSGE
jgi:hypothetical protein